MDPRGLAETLLVTGAEVLRSEVERIVAAAGGQLRTVRDDYWTRRRSGTPAAACWLAATSRDAAAAGGRRPCWWACSGDGDGLWHLAASIGAERVAVLPERRRMAGGIPEPVARAEPGGLVLGVAGGCGGAGATTAAVWMRPGGCRLGARVLLIDGDAGGGGLELALAAEDVPGLRWPDLAGASGSIDPGQLDDALPTAGGFSFLSWPGTRKPAGGVDVTTVAGS